MRRRAIQFRFRVIRLSEDTELTYLPKLGESQVDELTNRLLKRGYAEPKEVNVHPRILRFASETSILRLMPRGLLIGPHGTFERLGALLEVPHDRPHADGESLSWQENDFQRLFPSPGGLTYLSKGRHSPSRNRFASEIAHTGPLLSADELYMILATARACAARTIELLTTRPANSADLTAPILAGGRGYLHRVRMQTEAIEDELDEAIDATLAGHPPFSPLSDSTIIFGGAVPPVASEGLREVAEVLREWVTDPMYLSGEYPGGAAH